MLGTNDVYVKRLQDLRVEFRKLSQELAEAEGTDYHAASLFIEDGKEISRLLAKMQVRRLGKPQ